MEITQPLPQALSAGRAASEGASASPLSSDFETFLRMLTTQMQNQDPLEPAEASDFAVQLATFSSVEQQVLTNDLLREIGGVFSSGGLAQLGAWIGMEARSPAAVRFEGAPLTLHLPRVPGADSAELVVRDATGAEVQRLPVPPDQEEVAWAGVADDGKPLDAALYRFEVESRNRDEDLGSAPVELYQRIREVRLGGDAQEVVFEGGGAAAAPEITALR